MTKNWKKAIVHNCKLYDLLKTDNRIVFKVCIVSSAVHHAHTTQDFQNCKGLYESSLLQQAVNIMWFSGPSGSGVTFSDYFSPIPLKTIALIYTVVSLQ